MGSSINEKSSDLSKEKIITDKEWLELSWNYFSILSGQRMGMIDFYIVVEVALIGAFFTMIGGNTRMLWAECTVCAAIALISFVFYLLDYRNKTMIHCCEKIMSDIEEKYALDKHDIKLPFHYIERKTEKAKIRITYSVIFRFLFLLIGVFGLVCFILLICGII